MVKLTNKINIVPMLEKTSQEYDKITVKNISIIAIIFIMKVKISDLLIRKIVTKNSLLPLFF